MRHRRCLYTSWFQSSSCCWPGVGLPSLWGQCWCQGLHPPPQTPTWGTVWSTRAITTSPTHPPTTTTTSPERSTGGAGRQGTHIVRSRNPLIKIISHSSKKEKKKDFISITTTFLSFSFFISEHCSFHGFLQEFKAKRLRRDGNQQLMNSCINSCRSFYREPFT